MHYSGPTFRPPFEANSLLLQATTGCSHNKCTFCILHRNETFCASPLSEIEEDLREARYCSPHAARVFLLNADAFSLPADRLLAIADLIHEYLPHVCQIAAYGRIGSIQSKTDEQLRALAQAGYSGINIGLESAHDDVLAWMNKGYDAETALTQLERMNVAGLKYSVNIIMASLEPERRFENAKVNAAALNRVKPYLIFISPLHIDPGSELERMALERDLRECTLGQYIEEEIALLEGLELDDCVFYGQHGSNPIPVLGRLQRNKDRMLRELRFGLDRMPSYVRDSRPRRNPEGLIQ